MYEYNCIEEGGWKGEEKKEKKKTIKALYT